MDVKRIPLEQIRPAPERYYFGVNHLDALVDRMRAHGLVEPIVVRWANNAFEIVDGRKRWWAARFLGWRSIDSKVV